ncbi:hypothetical protein [Niabella hibiscisoli]|uniref:hypothetical protein n=1 Tax=Niabella hibiscisoli TaxID=1825928 RepID=UPI001F0F9C3E|nr:hypothetical protein [Niabella hibiscisoli]MCH5716052.1 hypothetical protein [Niabella hibiscisoli]
MFNKLINLIKGKSDPAADAVRIPFGRYSDNNKTVAKGSRGQMPIISLRTKNI